jgi:hypothetical protein
MWRPGESQADKERFYSLSAPFPKSDRTQIPASAFDAVHLETHFCSQSAGACNQRVKTGRERDVQFIAYRMGKRVLPFLAPLEGTEFLLRDVSFAVLGRYRKDVLPEIL